jgi:hypothetical protein
MTTNYSEVIQAENNRVFFKKLVTKLYKELTNYFGEKESEKILNDLHDGNITIINPENFLFSYKNMGDETLEFCKKCKNFTEFIQKATFYFKEKENKGDSKIIVREFFAGIAHLIGNRSKLENIEEQLHSDLTNFILSLSSNSKKSSFIFQMPNYRMAPDLGKIFNIQTFHYAGVLHILADCYANLIESKVVRHLPKLEFVYAVYKDASNKQKEYLKEIFPSRTKKEIENCLKEVTSLSKDSIELQIALETLAQKDYKDLDISYTIGKLKEIEEQEPLKAYVNQSS